MIFMADKRPADRRPGEEKLAHESMQVAFDELKYVSKKTRENSLALTKIEEAMMWNNKDRAMKGQLGKNETHVE